MKLLTTLAALCLTTATLAQATFTDPANLRGERVAPLTGRELPIDQGASGLQQLLRKLNTRASIMNIVAHPDDEDGGMMTLYSRGLGARVADLSLTRGEGGQNAMTADFEDALGLLRTQELLSCDRYSGVDQFFGTEVDFGFSKTKEESFAKWTHERVLYDVVRAIRLYRPLVLTSTWIGGVTDGHGQHQVSGEIAQEAFVAAGDPKVFPELTAEGILPWQPLRIYARVPMQSISERGLFDYATGEYTPAKFTNYVTGEVTTTPPTTDAVVHEGTPDPLLADETGKLLTYVQFARIGLSLQRSQVGPGVRNAPQGAFDVAYHLYGSRICNDPNSMSHTPTNAVILSEAKNPCILPAAAIQPKDSPTAPNFFTGIDTSIESIATLTPNAPSYLQESLATISAQIAQATSTFNPQNPSAIAPILGDTLTKLDALIPRLESASFNPTERENVLHELRIKQVQLNDALVLAYDLKLDATSEETTIPYEFYVPAKAQITAPPERACIVKHVWLQNAEGTIAEAIEDPKTKSKALTLKPIAFTFNVMTGKDRFETPFSTVLTRPYFQRDNIEQPVYELRIPSLRNAPQSPNAFTAFALVACGDIEVQIGGVVRYAYDDKEPVQVVPALDISLSSHAQVLPIPAHHLHIEVRDQSFGSRAYLTGICLPSGCVAKASKYLSDRREIYTLDVPRELWNHEFNVTARGATEDDWKGIVNPAEGLRPIGYGDLPRTNYYTPATTRIVPVDLKLPIHHNIAYLPGTGDSIPEALASINLKPTLLTIADLTPAKLAQYDTVILGVRAYSAHPDLHGTPTQALLNYARNGGNVVVQYQTTEFTADDAPYPLSLGSNEKVVDETAPVHLLDAKSPLLTTPNLITPADFNNWIEERGHGFLTSWDPHYTALTETHDPGQSPQRGGLITTPLGSGRWTYCAFALYRQLPEAVPGAYRLFLNLLTP